MKFTGMKWICRVLIASLLMLQFSVSQATMIGAEETLSPATVQADRTTVSSALSRTEVASQLQLLGVDPQLAQARVAAMTDSEVHALAGNIDTMPTGAMFHYGWWLVGLAVAVFVYFNWKR